MRRDRLAVKVNLSERVTKKGVEGWKLLRSWEKKSEDKKEQ